MTVGIEGQKYKMSSHLCLFFKQAGPSSVEDFFQGDEHGYRVAAKAQMSVDKWATGRKGGVLLKI